ncbi:MAG: hypothetical protein R3244_10995, partial [Thermoanaerobaculia bacterium]|nr:hypothetical protein [Thermoanaerobaculia bacterium]
PGGAGPSGVTPGAAARTTPVHPAGGGGAALPEARWVEVAGYGHNDLLASPEVWRELESFLESL